MVLAFGGRRSGGGLGSGRGLGGLGRGGLDCRGLDLGGLDLRHLDLDGLHCGGLDLDGLDLGGLGRVTLGLEVGRGVELGAQVDRVVLGVLAFLTRSYRILSVQYQQAPEPVEGDVADAESTPGAATAETDPAGRAAPAAEKR